MSAVVDPMYRPLGLETDVSNQNFVGARNPDDLLWVQFSMKAIQNHFLTAQHGRPMFEDQLWVEIRVPGNQLLTIETPATEEHKRRFPRQWAYFQQTHSPDGQNIGTPLSQWPILRPSQIEELRSLRFYTVENVAFASDEQIGRIGMIAGMAPAAFRERARLYLEGAEQHALQSKQAEELKARMAEIESLKQKQADADARHQEEMAELRALIKAAAAAPPPRRRRGRPPNKPPTEET